MDSGREIGYCLGSGRDSWFREGVLSFLVEVLVVVFLVDLFLLQVIHSFGHLTILWVCFSFFTFPVPVGFFDRGRVSDCEVC